MKTLKFYVYVTPTSRVGGEFPKPLSFRSKHKAKIYADRCRELGMGVRVTVADSSRRPEFR